MEIIIDLNKLRIKLIGAVNKTVDEIQGLEAEDIVTEVLPLIEDEIRKLMKGKISIGFFDYE